MASYTMELRTIVEQATQYQEGLTRDEKIEAGRAELFDFDYPIFDETYRKVFETHFIKNFYMREIGFETEGYFKLRLENWLSINMPYFNQLFESELINFDPMTNMETDVTHNKKNDRNQNDTRDVTSNSTGNSTGSSTDNTDSTSTQTDDDFTRKINSDTPDSRLAITTNDGQGVIEYASGIDEKSENNTSDVTANQQNQSNFNQDQTSDSTGNESLNSTINDIEDYIQHRAGKIGVQSYSKMLQEYRSTFLRIEKEIFEEMQKLFMLVY